VCLIIMMVHDDLFPSTNDQNRESKLRGIINDHNLGKILDPDDKIYRVVSSF